MLYPFVFHPIFKERIWGGREIERLFGKALPPGKLIGESWEISDRPGDESVVQNGALAGKTLRWLTANFRRELAGDAGTAAGDRFPILCKILDARDMLSLQVHPPGDKAAGLGGAPKTELWFIAAAAPGAELYAGLKRGTTAGEFERRIADGSVAECFHRIPVRAGDAMFLPSGRVHAIGAGLVIFEIQENSDTTYRVFDWNRAGLDGRPRDLHIRESLASIDFDDFEPELVPAKPSGGGIKSRPLVEHPLFEIEQVEMRAGAGCALAPRRMQIVAVVAGRLTVGERNGSLDLRAGQFCLVPAALEDAEIAAKSDATWLRVDAR